MRHLKFNRFVFLIIVLIILTVGWLNANAITDWIKLRGYNPPADITALVKDDSMTAYTKHLFYVNHPQLISSVVSFRQQCPNSPSTIVLGCYRPGLNGIYLYSVQSPQLAGVTQVTAAHEVLHAVYERLSTTERSKLDSELESFYKTGLHNQRVLAEVKIYQQTEPNDVYDEMSCTFGTELSSLPASLETYYSKYFSNRQKIVAYENQYEGAFTNRQAQLKADDDRLSSLKDQINSMQAALSAQLSQINSDKSKLDQEQASGNSAAYNAGVPAYNTAVDKYNNLVYQLKSDINAYNTLVSQRNKIATDLAALQKSLDTRTIPHSVTQ